MPLPESEVEPTDKNVDEKKLRTDNDLGSAMSFGKASESNVIQEKERYVQSPPKDRERRPTEPAQSERFDVPHVTVRKDQEQQNLRHTVPTQVSRFTPPQGAHHEQAASGSQPHVPFQPDSSTIHLSMSNTSLAQPMLQVHQHQMQLARQKEDIFA